MRSRPRSDGGGMQKKKKKKEKKIKKEESSCTVHWAHVKEPQVTKNYFLSLQHNVPHSPIHSFTLFQCIVSNALVGP